MKIYLDIETIPSQRPDILADIRAQVEMDVATKADSIRQQYKKPETIEAHLRDLRESVPALVDQSHRKTALDGGFGEILCIGWALADQPAQAICRKLDEPEADLLLRFFSSLPASTMTALHWIGHNITNFDLRFLWQRCLVLGVRPNLAIPLDGRDGIVTDTMIEWAGRYARDKWPSLDELCRVFRVASPKAEELDGSRVWDFAQAGRFDEIAEYCRRDVEATRAIFRAMGLERAA